jgi:hypothetical protein
MRALSATGSAFAAACVHARTHTHLGRLALATLAASCSSLAAHTRALHHCLLLLRCTWLLVLLVGGWCFLLCSMRTPTIMACSMTANQASQRHAHMHLYMRLTSRTACDKYTIRMLPGVKTPMHEKGRSRAWRMAHAHSTAFPHASPPSLCCLTEETASPSELMSEDASCTEKRPLPRLLSSSSELAPRCVLRLGAGGLLLRAGALGCRCNQQVQSHLRSVCMACVMLAAAC